MAQRDLKESIGALKQCMEFLGLSPDERTQAFSPRVIEANGRATGGFANADFVIDLHAHDGPFIEFDDTIRGFGIPYNIFMPKFQSFAFEEMVGGEGIGILTVRNSNPTYSFMLQVRR